MTNDTIKTGSSLLESNWFPNGPSPAQIEAIEIFRRGENAVKGNWNPNGDRAYIQLQNDHNKFLNEVKFGGGG